MFNLKKKDSVAEEVAKILAQEAELSPKQKKIAKMAGDKDKIDAADFAALRAGKKMEEGFDDMEKYLKDKAKPQPSGGAGKKQGSRYGGSKQKEDPKEKDDMKETYGEEVEQVDEISLDLAKRARDKAEHMVDADHDDMRDRPYGYSEKQRVKFQKYVDKKESKKNVKEEVEQVDEKAPPGFEGTVKAMKKHKEIDNPFALAWSMKNKGYKSHKKADGSMKKEEVELEEEDLDEAVSRKHFQQVADVIKAHPDQEKRNELAKHHAEIFKKQNPRFDHGRFYTAAGAKLNEEEIAEADINKDRTKDMISGRKPTNQTDDVGPGSDGKSTKAKLSAESWLKKLKKK